MRAPFNVLVLPYIKKQGKTQYCIFKRKDMQIWQFIAGGGEDGEMPESAAKREIYEESGISNISIRRLTTMTYVPAFHFSDKSRKVWGQNVLVIPVYCFSICVDDFEITLSEEHTEHRWVDYESAVKLLNFDVDKTAVWELNSILD